MEAKDGPLVRVQAGEHALEGVTEEVLGVLLHIGELGIARDRHLVVEPLGSGARRSHVVERGPHCRDAKPTTERALARVFGDLGPLASAHDEVLTELLLHLVDDVPTDSDPEDVVGNARHEVLFEVGERCAVLLANAAREVEIARVDRLERRRGLRMEREMVDELLRRDDDLRPGLAASFEDSRHLAVLHDEPGLLAEQPFEARIGHARYYIS